MRSTFRKLTEINGITAEELFNNRHVMEFSDSQGGIWNGNKHYAF